MKLIINTEDKTIELLETINIADFINWVQNTIPEYTDWEIKVTDWSKWKEVNKPATPNTNKINSWDDVRKEMQKIPPRFY